MGSANASRNGLPGEGEQGANANIEAAVLSHGPGTVFMDFTCSIEGSEFAFNDLWEIRQCSNIKLEGAGIQLTLLTRLPHFNGYSLSPEEEAAIAPKIQVTVVERDHQTDKFESDIDKNFLEFWDTERAALRRLLLAQVVEVARELCRTGQFDWSLTLREIQVCEKDAEWLSGYTRFIGGGINQWANRLRQQINPDFGNLVKAGVGAKVQEDEIGRPIRKKVVGEIIQSYKFVQRLRPHDCRASVVQVFASTRESEILATRRGRLRSYIDEKIVDRPTSNLGACRMFGSAASNARLAGTGNTRRVRRHQPHSRQSHPAGVAGRD